MKKRVAIRLDAGPAIGSGHLMRCLTIADALFQRYQVEVVFICRNPISIQLKYKIIYLKNEYNMQYDSYSYPALDDEVAELVSVLEYEKIEVLLVDHYGAGDSYFERLREYVKYLFVVDDGLGRNISVDGIINGNLYGVFSDYKLIPMQLVGGQYTLLRDEFCRSFHHKINNHINDIFITSGGADPTKFCLTMLQSMYSWNNNINYHVIVGNDFDEKYILQLEACHAKIHINASMKECMLQADLFISSAGSTLYELIVTHTPSISFCISKDQEILAKTIWNMELSAKGGNYPSFNELEFHSLLENYSLFNKREEQSRNMKNVIAIDGAKRVADRIYKKVFSEQAFLLRPVEKSDCDVLFRWANDDTNRNNSFSKEKIGYIDHCKWFANKLKDQKCHIYIFEQSGVEIGQVRLDGAEEAEIDYYISPAFRGRKLSIKMLQLIEKVVKSSDFGINFLVARVLEHNIISKRVFCRLGYQEEITASYVLYRKKI